MLSPLPIAIAYYSSPFIQLQPTVTKKNLEDAVTPYIRNGKLDMKFIPILKPFTEFLDEERLKRLLLIHESYTIGHTRVEEYLKRIDQVFNCTPNFEKFIQTRWTTDHTEYLIGDTRVRCTLASAAPVATGPPPA